MLTLGVPVRHCFITKHPQTHTSAASSLGWALPSSFIGPASLGPAELLHGSAASQPAALPLGVGKRLAEAKGQLGPHPADYLGFFNEPRRFKTSPKACQNSEVGNGLYLSMGENTKSHCKGIWVQGGGQLWTYFMNSLPHGKHITEGEGTEVNEHILGVTH